MPAKSASALDALQPKMLQMQGESALKNLQDRRAAHGRVLERACQIAGWSKKEAAAALGVTPPQLTAWFTGNENPQTWRFQQHPVLGKALLLAQAEDESGVVPTIGFSVPMDFAAKKEPA